MPQTRVAWATPLLCAASAAASAAGAACALKSVTTPMTITTPGAVVQNLDITLPASSPPGTKALTIRAANVMVRNVHIYYPSDGEGIYFVNSNNISIDSVHVQAYGNDCPDKDVACPNVCSDKDTHCHNIHGENSTSARITNARLAKGSSGIWLGDSPYATISNVDIKDVKGPFPRGQCVQLSHCDNSLVSNFSCINYAATSWTEDTLSMWRSSNCTVRYGLVDGNNSPHGKGVMFEGSDANTKGGTIHDVDAIHQGGGCFSGYPAQQLQQRRVHAAHTHCTGWGGRAAPMSGSLGWSAGNEVDKTTGHNIVSHGIDVQDSGFYDLCQYDRDGRYYWEESKGGFLNDKPGAVKLDSFEQRYWPINVSLCWEDNQVAAESFVGSAVRTVESMVDSAVRAVA